MKDGLSRFWAAWKKFGLLLGDIVARVVLTLFYFTIYVPFGLGFRLFADRLDMNDRPPKWLERHTGDLTLKDARRLW
jgi:hypothetical protein